MTGDGMYCTRPPRRKRPNSACMSPAVKTTKKTTERARYCLACGTALRTVRQEGRRRRRCPRCGWTFYDNPVPATVAVVEGPRGVLLARRAGAPFAGTWDLPGGFLEAGELPERG